MPISNQPQSFRLGWLAETVTEDAYVASRFCDYIGRQPDPQAAIKAIEESNDFDVPLGEPIAVNDPLDVIGKLTKLHLIEVPLLDDEELLERKVRVWDNDFKQPYLTLYTSKAEIHIPLIGHEIGDGALRRLTGPRPGARTRMVAAPVMVPALAVNLAKELGKAMLSEAGTAAWSYVKKNVLGLSDIPAYYQEVLQRIEEIVILGFDRERSANMRRYAMGFDSALVQYDVYKKSIEERELAISYLTKAEDNNRDLLNLADIYNDQAPSIENLMFLKDAALMFMCIMQEKYVRAQDSSVKTNIKALIAEEAQRYAVKLQERHDKYLAFRLGKISTEPYYTWLISRSPKGRTIGGVTEGLYNPTVVNNRIVAQWVGAWTSVSTYRFEDTGNDFRCSLAFQWACELSTRPDGGLGTHKRLSKELLNRYRSAVSEQTLTDLAAVREASAQLLKLKDNPIPV